MVTSGLFKKTTEQFLRCVVCCYAAERTGDFLAESLLRRKMALCKRMTMKRQQQLHWCLVGAAFAFALVLRQLCSAHSIRASVLKQAQSAAGVVLVDRSHWGRIRVSGADRLKFLHGQSTAEFLGQQPGQGLDTVCRLPSSRLFCSHSRQRSAVTWHT